LAAPTGLPKYCQPASGWELGTEGLSMPLGLAAALLSLCSDELMVDQKKDGRE